MGWQSLNYTHKYSSYSGEDKWTVETWNVAHYFMAWPSMSQLMDIHIITTSSTHTYMIQSYVDTDIQYGRIYILTLMGSPVRTPGAWHVVVIILLGVLSSITVPKCLDKASCPRPSFDTAVSWAKHNRNVCHTNIMHIHVLRYVCTIIRMHAITYVFTHNWNSAVHKCVCMCGMPVYIYVCGKAKHMLRTDYLSSWL